MIKNDKFVIPNNPKPQVKKLYQYSHSFENDWNSPHLASSKISKYYHDVQKKFLKSPNSPSNQSLLQRQHDDKMRSVKIQQLKTSAKSRLDARKFERTEVIFK